MAEGNIALYQIAIFIVPPVRLEPALYPRAVLFPVVVPPSA